MGVFHRPRYFSKVVIILAVWPLKHRLCFSSAASVSGDWTAAVWVCLSAYTHKNPLSAFCAERLQLYVVFEAICLSVCLSVGRSVSLYRCRCVRTDVDVLVQLYWLYLVSAGVCVCCFLTPGSDSAQRVSRVRAGPVGTELSGNLQFWLWPSAIWTHTETYCRRREIAPTPSQRYCTRLKTPKAQRP